MLVAMAKGSMGQSQILFEDAQSEDIEVGMRLVGM
jgi:hypothetical protein